MRIAVYLITLFLLASCGDADSKDITLRLTSQERRQIDTLVTRQVKAIRPYYDSICAADFDQMVAAAMDSILQRRLEEEARLKSRIPLNSFGQ
ncbi:MAG: hypothetical protein AAF828_11725 [Bacteroidota bacterium]